MRQPGPVYFVTDPTAPLPVAQQALAAAKGGAWAVQLRDKTATDDQLIATARQIKSLLAPMGVALIVNDRAQVALEAVADGLHIGQGDGDPARIRAMIGAKMMLGLSIDNPAQLAAIPPGCIDHIGTGPVRATATKPDHAAPFGFDGLALIAARAPCPAIAIGGLALGDARALRLAGVAGAAYVSAIARTENPEQATRQLVREWGAP
ncbi:thiamine phosphate synthase [Paracoccus sp. M683]|uniref:thiamine phosphate synthase n=1 Tax=Paracoccus sp. M683 TaxID=2594268 RepID=UPI00117ECAAD|nr:thiamine phosphate synthase [Paracoccus sp. M683]TRW97229.1 thiamine phosphate synthase [Paracoccus sp. M683]